MNLALPEQLLLIAALTAVTGYLVACWQQERWPRLGSLVAGGLLSASAGASAAYLALFAALLPLTPAGAGLLGFAVGAVWGPSGLWRLVSWLGPRPPEAARPGRGIRRRGLAEARQIGSQESAEPQESPASNLPGKVLD